MSDVEDILPLVVLAAMLLLGARRACPAAGAAEEPARRCPRRRAQLRAAAAGRRAGAAAGPLQRAQAWVLEKQAQFNRELAAAVRSLKTASPLSATLMLAALASPTACCMRRARVTARR